MQRFYLHSEECVGAPYLSLRRRNAPDEQTDFARGASSRHGMSRVLLANMVSYAPGSAAEKLAEMHHCSALETSQLALADGAVLGLRLMLGQVALPTTGPGSPASRPHK